jgi:hypothetical protein
MGFWVNSSERLRPESECDGTKLRGQAVKSPASLSFTKIMQSLRPQSPEISDVLTRLRKPVHGGDRMDTEESPALHQTLGPGLLTGGNICTQGLVRHQRAGPAPEALHAFPHQM